MEKPLENVRLSFACSEDWGKFKTIDDRARLCGSCKCRVVDFTNATQDEFDREMNSGKKVCGRFNTSQLSESFLKLAAASLVAVSATAVSCSHETAEPQKSAAEHCQIQPTRTMGVPLIVDDQNDSINWSLAPKVIPDPELERIARLKHLNEEKK
jgi:hypothetical protein